MIVYLYQGRETTGQWVVDEVHHDLAAARAARERNLWGWPHARIVEWNTETQHTEEIRPQNIVDATPSSGAGR